MAGLAGHPSKQTQTGPASDCHEGRHRLGLAQLAGTCHAAHRSPDEVVVDLHSSSAVPVATPQAHSGCRWEGMHWISSMLNSAGLATAKQAAARGLHAEPASGSRQGAAGCKAGDDKAVARAACKARQGPGSRHPLLKSGAGLACTRWACSHEEKVVLHCTAAAVVLLLGQVRDVSRGQSQMEDSFPTQRSPLMATGSAVSPALYWYRELDVGPGT